ncbi:MAG: hypothetical protein JW720_05730 [Sedimentisphaerales bacterium]|nr:hypothetical protein [Sedimentisphaerales bacterium]
MKEIDFLPEWYKNGKRRDASYRTMYVVLGGIFAIMMVWNFFASSSVSRAEAELTRIAGGNAEAQAAARDFSQIKNLLAELQKQTETIQAIDSRINVAGVLAELSFVVDGPIVLRKVQITAEKFADTAAQASSNRPGSLVRAARVKKAGDQKLPIGDVRFKIEIGGVAAKAGDVAALICKLEDSPYFFQVVLLFSRNIHIKSETEMTRRTENSRDERNAPAVNVKASEFEIRCYLANYRQQ